MGSSATRQASLVCSACSHTTRMGATPARTAARTLSSSSRSHGPDKSKYILKEHGAAFPKGFKAGGASSGVKKNGALDLGLITSTTSQPASAAACFTKNVFQAAPVQVSQAVLRQNGGRARSLIVNSGCANAVTGKQGLQNAWTMARKTDENLATAGQAASADSSDTLVMSTGVIGQHVQIDKIISTLAGLPAQLGDNYKSWSNVSKAFMTTDTFPKLRTRSIQLGGQEVRFVGIDKGAGMIHPRMGPPHATLLGMIATDAAIEPRALQSALTYAIDRSFNSISVDGDMSTNDTVVALANSASGANTISSESSKDFDLFRGELTDFATELASLVVRDGEGATKFVKITVKGSPNYEDAHHIASVIARSPLVKTAIHGADANWGRILCATGYSTPSFAIDPTKVSVTFVPTDGSEALKTLVNGEPLAVDEARAKKILDLEDITIEVDLQLGRESASYYTCDFSKEYVTINGDYRS